VIKQSEAQVGSAIRSPERVGYFLGSFIQGIVLGIGLIVAIAELLSAEFGSTIFRYQGF
jgi:hypothetical protein